MTRSTNPLIIITQFLQAGCPSCHPTNSIKALMEGMTTTLLWIFTTGICDVSPGCVEYVWPVCRGTARVPASSASCSAAGCVQSPAHG